ncbi:dynactin subunit 2-like [Varroa jacobsoni]|uniref:Dynactin subunit 2 n=1 Tax=Varroa destructor TaxID=109461 RepID=A0A7M7MBI3_VARDE|nr:dynactin subunit 2-like [Varroa destructor]XP_022649916.1 dynactin subunit 2-like [Varroa destructor]XP_022703547.1 dynactin subunit 2-like [Varroa jacobsoni]XP_022703548.1 dynactin subunit 2-like [Varroa jacobsoni]
MVMALNSKYAELPGFAHDQPDLYETDDLPEAEQAIEPAGDDSEAVEVLHISTKDAYIKFKGSRVDTSKSDFTDSIAPRRKTGFHVIHGDWELSDDKENESLPQRYHRIKTEVKQFLEDVAAIETEKRPENHEVLLADMEMLEKLLADVNLDAVMGEGHSGDRNGQTINRLLGQLASLRGDPQNKEAQDTGVKKTSAKEKSSLTYELYYKPEYSKLQQAQQVAALEERLRQLEATVGDTRTDKLSMLATCAGVTGRSLQDACDELSSKLYLLDPTNIERVESQLAGLHERLLAVSERKTALEEAQRSDKIAQMYEVSRKVDQLLPSLSNILQSLTSLQELHEHALQFSKCLTTLEAQQSLMMRQLKGDEDLVKKLQERIEKDVEAVADNISKLELRMEAFKK